MNIHSGLGSGVPKNIQQQLFKAANYTCYYCKRNAKKENLKLGLDHKTPRSKGGAHDLSNIVVSCISCNSKKGTLTEEEFRIKLASLDKSAQELGRKRWKDKSAKEKKDHALMMVSKRANKQKGISTASLTEI